MIDGFSLFGGDVMGSIFLVLCLFAGEWEAEVEVWGGSSGEHLREIRCFQRLFAGKAGRWDGLVMSRAGMGGGGGGGLSEWKCDYSGFSVDYDMVRG